MLLRTSVNYHIWLNTLVNADFISISFTILILLPPCFLHFLYQELAVLAEDLCSIPSTQVRWLTIIAYNSRESNTLFYFYGTCIWGDRYTRMHIRTGTHTYMKINPKHNSNILSCSISIHLCLLKLEKTSIISLIQRNPSLSCSLPLKY